MEMGRRTSLCKKFNFLVLTYFYLLIYYLFDKLSFLHQSLQISLVLHPFKSLLLQKLVHAIYKDNFQKQKLKIPLENNLII